MSQPELVCARCQPLEARVAELEHALRSLQHELNENSEELGHARSTIRTLERQVAHWKGKATPDDDEDKPEVKKIMAFQEFWKVTTGQKNVRLLRKGKRFKDVEQAFNIANEDELRHAIRGAALKPWVAFGRRYVTRPTEPKAHANAEIKLSVRDIIGDEDKIEKHRKIYLETLASVETQPDLLYAEWQQAAAVEAQYARLMLKCAARTDRFAEPSETTLKALSEADRVIAFLDAPDDRPELELAA